MGKDAFFTGAHAVSFSRPIATRFSPNASRVVSYQGAR